MWYADSKEIEIQYMAEIRISIAISGAIPAILNGWHTQGLL